METGTITTDALSVSCKVAPQKRSWCSTFSASVGSGISAGEKCPSGATEQTACCSPALKEAAFYKRGKRVIILSCTLVLQTDLAVLRISLAY